MFNSNFLFNASDIFNKYMEVKGIPEGDRVAHQQKVNKYLRNLVSDIRDGRIETEDPVMQLFERL